MNTRLITAESVTEGHPDKVADLIADSIVDAYLAADPGLRVRCEVLATTGLVVLAGILPRTESVAVQDVVRKTIADIGYREENGYCPERTQVAVVADADGGRVREDAVAESFGFACDETPELLPYPVTLSHALARQLARYRRTGPGAYLRPDGKTQVTVEYEDGRPARVDTVLLSTQHDPDVDLDWLRKDLASAVVGAVIPEELCDEDTRVIVNPTPRFVVGGPTADTGLTGRKLAVDTYGGLVSHGGAVLSGRHPAEGGRALTYAARWLARAVVAANAARRCTVRLSTANGRVELGVDAAGTSDLSDEDLARLLTGGQPITSRELVAAVSMASPAYRQTAAYGHFSAGAPRRPWETDRLPHP
jgi:S-adenosylmethionine synthetase